MKTNTPRTGEYGQSMTDIGGTVRQLLLDPLTDSPRWMSAQSFKARRAVAYQRKVKSQEVERMKAEEQQIRTALSALRSGKKLTLGWF